MPSISWLDLVILIFAAFRFTHLIVLDTITWPLRRPFMEITEVTDANGRKTHHASPKPTGIGRWIGNVLVCQWCFGIWSAALMVALYYFVPMAYPLLLILAIAGVSSIVEYKLTSK